MAIDPTASTAYASVRYAPRPQSARTVADAASVKQLSFIEDMVREIHKLQVREISLAQGEHDDATRAILLGTLGSEDDAVRVQMSQTFTYGETGTINRLIAARNRHRKLAQEMARRAHVTAPSASVAGPVVLEADQTYRAADGRVIRVVMGQSGHLYGKVWTPETQSFEYLPGLLRVPGMVLMSLAEVSEFGQQTGQCCVCCTPLTDTVSIALGIGPVCESRYTGKARSRSQAYRASVLAEYAARMAEQAPAPADVPALPAEDAPF